MSDHHSASTLDKLFTSSLLLKGILGLTEFILGLLLLVFPPESLYNFLATVTQRQLLNSQRDSFINFLLGITYQFDGTNRMFFVTYLWIQAFIKLVSVIGLLKNKLWAYPFSLVIIGILVIYQLYVISNEGSIGMIFLTIFDLFILVMIWRAYKRARIEQEADLSEAAQ